MWYIYAMQRRRRACSVASVVQLCDPMDHSLPGSSVHGILQARMLEWVAMSSSRGIFPTQGSKLHLLRLLLCKQILYCWAITETPQWNASQPQKELIWGSCSEVDEPRASTTERSKSEREKQIYVERIYMESRKMVLMNLVSGKQRRGRWRERAYYPHLKTYKYLFI